MGSYKPTLNMKAILVLLLVTCLLVEAGRPRKYDNKKQKSKKDSGRKMPRHGDKGERVWHIAASEEECGDASATLYQSHDKPYDLCSEVNTTINVCTTRDTEMVPATAVDVDEDVDESENEIEPHGASNPAQARLSHHLFQKVCLRFHLSQLGPRFGVFKGKHLQLVLSSVLFTLLLFAIPEGCGPVLVLLPLPLLNRIGPSRWSRRLLPLVFLLHSPRLW